MIACLAVALRLAARDAVLLHCDVYALAGIRSTQQSHSRRVELSAVIPD